MRPTVRIHKTIGRASFVAALMAVAPALADDALDGKTLYATRTCVACHGRNGARAILAYPQLAGLPKDYLYAQMRDIESGARVSGPDARGFPRTDAMKDIMVVVTDDELKTIAAWLASAPAPPLAPAGSPDTAKGADLYAQSGCPACHGEAGGKPLPGYPIVAGQKREYLRLQLKDIREGVRKNGDAALMTQVIAPLKDADLDAIADYLSSTARPATP